MKKMLFILMLVLNTLTQAQSFKEQVNHEVGLSFANILPTFHAEYRVSYLFKSNQSLGLKSGCYFSFLNYYIPMYASFTQALTKSNHIRFMLDVGIPIISFESTKRFDRNMDEMLVWQSPYKSYFEYYKRFYNINTLFDFTAKKLHGFTFEVGLRWVFYEATDNLDKTLVVGMQPDFGFKWRIGCNKKDRKVKE